MADGAPTPTSPTSFALNDAAEIALAPYADREAARHRGVCWSGMGPDPVTPEQVERRRALMRAGVEAYQASDTGKLHAKTHTAMARARDIHIALAELQAALSRGDDPAELAERAQTMGADLKVALTELKVLARGVGAEGRA